jgi:hypothetical protein
VTDLVSRYQKAGVDQVMFVMQSGKNRHEHICEAIELFASEVLPRFAEEREAKDIAKAERLAAAVDRALARRDGPRSLGEPYLIDEAAELAAASGTGQVPMRKLASAARESAAQAVRRRAQLSTRRAVERASDQRIERLFGSVAAQRTVFARMAARFDAERAAGFSGAIVYDLGLPDGTRRPWTIDVSGGRARVRAGRTASPALTIGVGLADFIKLMTQTQNSHELVADGRLTLDGDLGLANRLGEMFGGGSAY